jgi:hypothetical protein
MARRQSSTGGMNLDSLMDTLTNVVGILLIILIFAVLGGQEAVKRIRGFVDEVSEEQLAAKAAESEALRNLIDEQRRNWDELETRVPQNRLTLEQQQQLLAQLQADLAKLSSSQIDPAQLQAQLTERRQKALELEQSIREKEEMLASLKARLAETPAQGAGADTKVVNLPDPRPAPEGAQPVVFLCRHGRVFPVDTADLQKAAAEVLLSSRQAVVRNDRIDCKRLAEIFEKRFVGDRYVKLGVRMGGDGKPALVVNHRDDAGDTAETLVRRTSLYNQLLSRLDPQQQYVEFRVWNDSFDTYLAARNEAARHGLTAGWTPLTETSDHTIGFGGNLPVCVDYTPPPPRPPTPPDPNRPPPPPADVVD